MSDPLIRDEIYTVLLDEGSVIVPTHGQFRHEAGIHGSSSQVKLALGSMIRDGVVLRERPSPQSCTDGERPITFSLRY